MQNKYINKEHILANEIISDHRERMLNLKKYYPFFRLAETSFSWFMEGRYEDRLDMGYIMMAVLRFFIEENNFKEKDVVYPEYVKFMKNFIRRDFDMVLEEGDSKVLVDYIFEKLKNDGKPFSFEYYDPVDRIKKISRVRLLESRIEDGTVWYSISGDGIEFYLDTKEIRDESRISVEQLLLEKMIQSKDFKGGVEVVKRINEEVRRLWLKKNQVIELLTNDVFAGAESYKDFFENGIKWFDDEQKLFVKNKELIEAALKRAETERVSGDSNRFFRTSNEIYKLDTELKIAMNNHSELLKACTELGIKTDEIIRKSKLSRLRSRFDFKSILTRMIKEDRPDILSYVVSPFLKLNIRKSFDFVRLEDILTYRYEAKETAEIIEELPERDIIFEDEIADERFMKNARTLFLILLKMLEEQECVELSEYHNRVRNLLSDAVYRNGDYYAFLVHLCGKKDYVLGLGEVTSETFLDDLIKIFMKEREFAGYTGFHFMLELAGGTLEKIEINGEAEITNFRIKRLKNG